MRYRLHILSGLLLCAALLFNSCKTQEKTTATTPKQQTAEEYEAPQFDNRKDPISEKKAIEEATFLEGCIYKLTGNKRAALGEFQEVLNMNPENSAANYEVAGLYHDLNQSDRALKYAAEAVRLDPQNKWYKFRYAEILQAVHRDEEAIAIYKDLVELDKNNSDLRYRLAACQKTAGKFDEAAKTYDEIEKLEGNSDTLGNCRLALYSEKKDNAGTEKTLRGLISSFPKETKYYYALAEFLSTSGRQEEANNIYREMVKLFPYAATPQLKLAELHKQAKEDAEAFKDAVAAFSIPEELDSKINYLQRWYPVTDSSAALSVQERKEADSLCRVLRRTHHDQAIVYTVYGGYLMKDNRPKEARDQYKKAITLSKDSYQPWKQLLMLNDVNKDDAQQEKDCKEVMELYPSQPDAYYYLGKIQYRKKKYAEAISNLQSALDYNLDHPSWDHEIKMILIDCYRATGETEKSEELVDALLKKEPDNTMLIVMKAKSLLSKGKSLYDAEQMMLGVVEKEPKNADYLETLAWIEYSMYDYKLADEWMSKALALEPSNARINERMGDIQYRLKKTDDALKYWNKAKSLGGSSPELEEKIKTKSMKDE